MLGKHKSEEQLKVEADFCPTFRYGTFDDSGYVSPMNVSNSKEEFAKLKIPENTKPFKYPIEGGKIGYVNVYLRGSNTLSDKYSYDGVWLSADLCYKNSELSGSLTGKLSEQYHRIGDIKSKMSGDFSFRANFFLVLMVVLAGLGIFYTIGVRLGI